MYVVLCQVIVIGLMIVSGEPEHVACDVLTN
jgi:hypothetical protein